MTILFTNDDGIHAEGLKVLTDRLQPLYDSIVIAPHVERSICGHTITLDRPLKVHTIREGRYSCDGYPADCVLVATCSHLTDKKVDLVISGINKGANLAQDIVYSGTLSAAREAACRGIKSIAISSALDLTSYHPGERIYYESAAMFLEIFLQQGGTDLIAPYQYLNINVPNLPFDKILGAKVTTPGFKKYDLELAKYETQRKELYFFTHGRYNSYIGSENSDCYAIEKGYISITGLNLLQDIADKNRQLESFVETLF